ncbi:MAG: hypothetical protein Q4C45_11320 [Oscillospiraceae bacterium]|nr:hypothetical protein [Oscillospiraceae bacterium]
MDRLEALKEAILEKQFEKEPLALSILLYLNRRDPQAHSEIMEIFEGLMDKRLDALISETLKNDLSGKTGI